MRDDGYSYLEDNELPKGAELVWLESETGCGTGFFLKGKWYWNKKNIVTKKFIEIKGKVQCWKYRETRKNGSLS